MAEQTPRINAKYLEKFVNHTVRIVGKVAWNVEAEEATRNLQPPSQSDEN
jgi:hypothetical protein